MDYEKLADLIADRVVARLREARKPYTRTAPLLRPTPAEVLPLLSAEPVTIRSLVDALGLPQDVVHARRVGRCLRELGAIETRRRVDGLPTWVWLAPPAPRPEDLL